MSFATVLSRAQIGVESPLVTIEVHLSTGLPAFQIVGLPETSVREARDRVRSAIMNSNFQFPQQRLTVNLAPADLPKEGGRFDLPIAIGILAASGQIPLKVLQDYEFYGELGLKGDIREIVGEVPSSLATKKSGRTAVLPKANARQANIVCPSGLVGAESLLQVFHHVLGQQVIAELSPEIVNDITLEDERLDLSDVIGQVAAKRALMIAAAGSHNLLFVGPPGTGKSMLAKRLPPLLPPMSDEEAQETAAVHSILGKKIDVSAWRVRPFRAPHHTCSGVALVGGGGVPKPGEISLAHNGVLFLDELPEYERKVLDVLREPLENGYVEISRARHQARFPSKFQLIAALNPSPTGHYDDGRANSEQVSRYLNRISGPFLDRVDLQVDVPLLPRGVLSQSRDEQLTTADAKQQINKARELMLQRSGKANAHLNNKELGQFCPLSVADQTFLEQTLHKLKLSIRAYHKIIKVARTIADLSESVEIQRSHIAEALSYRALDRILMKISR